MKKSKKRLDEMNSEELAEATREFNEPFVMDRGRPLNSAERKQHRSAARRARRPLRGGKGSLRINITIERDLLARADAVAADKEIGRSEMIASALKSFLAKAG